MTSFIYKKIFIIFFLIFQLFFLIFAQEFTNNNIVTLEDAINSAILKNTDILSAKINLETSNRQMQSSWNTFLPNFSVGGSMSLPHTFTPDFSGDFNWGFSAGANLRLTFSMMDQIQQNHLKYQISLFNYKQTEDKVLTNVIQSYYSLIAEKQNIKILEYSLQLAQNSYNQTLQNYNRGLASELDMLNAKYSYQSIKPNLDSAISTYSYNLSNFAILIGNESIIFSIDENIEIPIKQLSLPTGKKLCEDFLSNRYDVKLQELNVEQQKLALSSQTKSSYIPSINISESLNLKPTSDNSINFGGNLTVSTEIPLDSYIKGSKTSNTTQANEDALEAAVLALEKTKKMARNDIGQKAAEVNRLWNTIPLAQMNLAIATRSHELSNQGYNAGLVSRTDFDNARQKMTKAELEVISAKQNYFNAIHNLALSLQLSVSKLYELYGENK